MERALRRSGDHLSPPSFVFPRDPPAPFLVAINMHVKK